MPGFHLETEILTLPNVDRAFYFSRVAVLAIPQIDIGQGQFKTTPVGRSGLKLAGINVIA